MKSSPFKIAFIYLVAGVCWILASDAILGYLSGKQAYFSPVITAEIIKGLAYMLITSILLFFLVRYYFKRLSRSWAAYRNLFEDNPDPMLAFDPDTLKILAANNAALHQYGYTKKEFLSMTADKIKSKESVQRFLEIVRSGKDAFDKMNIQHHFTKSGKLLHVNVLAQNGLLDGKKVRWVLVRDMTEVKENEKLLKQALERHELVMKATKDIIWDLYLDSGQTVLLGAVFENFGYKVSSVGISWFNEKIHPDDLQYFWSHVAEINGIADPFWSDQFRLKCADGSYKYVNARGFIVYSDNGKPYRSIGVIQVIQKQKEYELKIENQNQLLKEIAHIVSHELRGPVASMMGMLSLIEHNENIPDELDTELHGLTRSAKELDKVIHSVMEKANQVYQE